jgi:O-antigen/teichoic acid export membrane protein
LRLARGSVWTVAGVAFQMATALLASIFAARILGTAHFGELSLARNTLAMFILLAGANLGVTTSRSVAALRVTDPDRAGRVIGLLFDVCFIASIIAAAICLALASPIARQLGAPQLARTIAISALFIVFASTSAVQLGALNGFEAFGAAARVTALEGVLNSGCFVAGAYFGGVPGAMIGMVTAAAMAFVLKLRVLGETCRRDGVTIRFRGVREELPMIWTFVIPAVILGLTTQPFGWLARAILARGPNGLSEVGVFGAAFTWGAAVMLVPAQVTRPALPILTNLLAEGDMRGFRRLSRDTLLTSLTISFAAALPIVALSPWIMRAYGAAFSKGVIVLVIVAASSIAGSVSLALRAALLATGDFWFQALQSILFGFTLIGVFWLARGRGAMGLAFAYVAAHAVSAGIQTVLTRAAIRRSHPGMAVAETLPDDVLSSNML